MSTTTIYGIRNCDAMKKAFTWLEAHEVAHVFHDYRKSGIDAETLARWCAQTEGWQALVNTRGTTWRNLSPKQQSIADEAGAIALMIANPSLIRRPVLETAEGALLIGFDPMRFEVALAGSGSQP